MTAAEALEVTFNGGDLNEEMTFREYLFELLKTLWEEEEGFSGKRPFGNSGWQIGIFHELVRCDVIKGSYAEDDDGYVQECDYDKDEAEQMVIDMIHEMCGMELPKKKRKR